jgi:hypothetical protein
MTLRTFFKNLFAPNSEAKPLYTPLDLRLLEHYEAWQKNREEGKKKERIERSELYQVLFQDNDREDAREEKNRRFFDQLIAQSTCLRAATVEDYNEWLTDWLQTGESITYYSGNPFSTWQVHYVQDPDTWVSLIQDRRYGASFPERSQYVFIIPKQYDCRDYLSAFCVENNAVYGWSNNEPGIYGNGSPSNRDNPHIPAFTDTVDQQMCQRAQAALDHCAEGERPEVDALDLRVFQEKDTYMRRQREMLARQTARRTFEDLERAQLIAADEKVERLEKQTLSEADRARPATCADYDRWLEAWVKAGNDIAYYSDSNFNEQDPDYFYVIDPDADFYIGDRTVRRFIIPEEYDCREYLYKFCTSPRAVVYGWADNKPVMHVQNMYNSTDKYPGGYADTVDARLRQQARLKYRQEQ